MADTKISALAALGAAPASTDVFAIVDVSDTTHAATGTTKKVTMANVIDAVEANANVFTANQEIEKGSAFLELDATSGSPALYFSEVGTQQWHLTYDPTANQFHITESGVSIRAAFFDGGNMAIGTTTNAGELTVNGEIVLVDGMPAPAVTAGWVKIWVDDGTGDLMVKFGNGVVKTLATDS